MAGTDLQDAAERVLGISMACIDGLDACGSKSPLALTLPVDTRLSVSLSLSVIKVLSVLH